MGRDYKKIRAWQLSDELAYYIDFSGRIEYIKDDKINSLLDLHVQATKTLRALINYIEKSNLNSPKSKVQSQQSI